MNLIDDFKKAHTFLSIQANTLGVAITTIYGSMYDQLKETLEPKYMMVVVGVIFVLGVIGRVIKQNDNG